MSTSWFQSDVTPYIEAGNDEDIDLGREIEKLAFLASGTDSPEKNMTYGVCSFPRRTSVPLLLS